MIDGFYKYKPKPEVAKKINAIRIGQSRPDLELPPILDNGSVLFSSAASAENEPRSCYNCPFFNFEKSCKLMRELGMELRKFTWPKERRDNAKPIEFWPVCGYWVKGEPNYGPAQFYADLGPDEAGLGWVNAPEIGQELGGTSCGGRNGGDDCDLWLIDSESGDKRAEDSGFCRVMQKDTANLDCCSAWEDDDWLTWQMVKERFNESKP